MPLIKDDERAFDCDSEDFKGKRDPERKKKRERDFHYSLDFQ